MNSGTKRVGDVVVGEFVRLYSEHSMQYTKCREAGVVYKQDGNQAGPNELVFVK